ncbi:MAG: FliA/WhiG family RNA polymerase sigma factor [Porticoccaceae bacterium]|nr:FliA/WhiG family RNA polymerase sigma factor [Porticoccaceae bacterium]MDG1475405.1 FliA/WhiG family RNA polymerase sigma factor [Porticoccaceae bacterium]
MPDINDYADIQNLNQSNEGLLKNIGLVKRVALHLKTRVPNFMELEELIQVGMIGLIEATKSFDSSKGVEFEVFAKNRIRGAILDQVRKMSYLPRSAMVNIREHNEAQQLLAGQLGREPTQSEMANFMEKDIEEYQKERNHANRFQTISLESQVAEPIDLPSSDDNDPESILSKDQMMESLAESIELLPEREKTIVALYYVEEMNLREIGAVLEISESRVSQVLSATVKALRKKMADEE